MCVSDKVNMRERLYERIREREVVVRERKRGCL
jgi:hypothetical protein